MIRARSTLAVVVLTACDPQVDGAFAGDPAVQLRGMVSGFTPDDNIDGASIRWNTQQGADLTTGPVSPAAIASQELGNVVIDVLDIPPAAAAFELDGVAIGEGYLSLVHGSTVMARAIDTVLVHVGRDVDDGSLAATYLGGATLAGYHLYVPRPTLNVPPAQAMFVEMCGGTAECESQRRYQLGLAEGDLAAEVRFFRSSQ